MKKNVFFITLYLFLFACQKENVQIEYPKVYNYSSYSFVGEIETYNSNGLPIEVSQSFEKDDFLFIKDPGVYPIDRIDLISETETKFYFSVDNFNFTKNGIYKFEDNSIHFEVYIENSINDTLFLIASYQEDEKLTFDAFGIKAYGPTIDNNGEILNSYNGFGKPYIDGLVNDLSSTDTLYIQSFNEIYLIEK